MTTVNDLMTPDPLTLGADKTVDVARMFLSYAHIRHLPVVEDGRVVGLVTSRDLLASTVKFPEGAKVSDIMQSDVRVIDAQEGIARAIDIMIEHKYGCLPVVMGNQLVGIITEADFLKFTRLQIQQGQIQ